MTISLFLVQRRLINPQCGIDWRRESDESRTYQMTQFIKPGSINFYRLSANYLHNHKGPRNERPSNLVVQASSNAIILTICISRQDPLPQSNNFSTNYANSQQGQRDSSDCKSLRGNSVSYDLSKVCEDYYTIHQCPPVYVSVEASAMPVPEAASSSISSSSRPAKDTQGLTYSACTEPGCQTPNQARYTLSLTNLNCRSSASTIQTQLTMTLFSILSVIILCNCKY